MNLASDDFVKAKNNFEKYSYTDFKLTNSREGILIANIFDAVEMYDSVKISFLSEKYDEISRLDKLQVKLLLQIKNNIDDFDNNDFENNDLNDNVMNDDIIDDIIDENDLC